MSDNQFKVYVQRDPYRDGLAIGIKCKINGRWKYAKPVDLIFEEKDEGIFLEPTLRVGGDYADDFIEAFRLALDGKTLDHFKGELDATKKHLEDMRHLVFEDKYKEIEDK